MTYRTFLCFLLFQSTLSVRRATVTRRDAWLVIMISIHALREESDLTVNRYSSGHVISIHALREESDTVMSFAPPDGSRFQSTLSVRRATCKSGNVVHDNEISIHALREESDAPSTAYVTPFG